LTICRCRQLCTRSPRAGPGVLLGGRQLRLDPAAALAAHTIGAARAAGSLMRN
jgi:hypothetical protein